MNTTLSTNSGRRTHPPEPLRRVEQHEIRRVNLLDRLALHLGVALITWGRRPLNGPSRALRSKRIAHRLELGSRERAAERALRLSVPRR
jgi:hypothetical protein